MVESEGRYRDLIKETQTLRANLEEKVNRRRTELETGIGVATRSRIRMRKEDLEKTLLAGRRMVQTFFPPNVFGRMESEGEVLTYWEGRGLEDGDWKSLTALLMTEVFCQDFLTPLEDSDVAFTLHVIQFWKIVENFFFQISKKNFFFKISKFFF